jgi:hypothetical protein
MATKSSFHSASKNVTLIFTNSLTCPGYRPAAANTANHLTMLLGFELVGNITPGMGASSDRLDVNLPEANKVKPCGSYGGGLVGDVR